MNKPTSKPAHQHDCTKCIYLGTASIDDLTFDYYCCEKDDGYYSLLARYDSETTEYFSTHPEHVTPLSLHGSIALSLYLRYLGVNGANAFVRGTFFRDHMPVFTINQASRTYQAERDDDGDSDL